MLIYLEAEPSQIRRAVDEHAINKFEGITDKNMGLEEAALVPKG